MASHRFGLVAGEASGDLLAALLLDGLRARWPDLQAFGVGGPQLASRGFDAWQSSDVLSVRGYLEVLPKLGQLLALRRQLTQRMSAERPDVFIGVDAPDFNFSLEARLKAAGIRTVHFVSPSFWAWRVEKLVRLKAAADHVLCIFPFEPDLLAQHGIAATYVGHPLAGVIPLQPDRAAARAKLGLNLEQPVLALLPGSRKAEVDHLAARFLAAAERVRQKMPALQVIVPAVPFLRAHIERIAKSAGVAAQIVTGQSHDALAACDVTLAASGTATLEAALFKRPMVISYHMNQLSYRIMRGRNLQPWVGLPNILCRDFVVPEILQDEATPQALADAVLGWFKAPQQVDQVQQRFTELHHTLRRDTAQLAGDAIERMLQRG
ncbi:MAG: lipid-A-disaccharide synthase [Burkholderiaceae bacterium]